MSILLENKSKTLDGFLLNKMEPANILNWIHIVAESGLRQQHNETKTNVNVL